MPKNRNFRLFAGELIGTFIMVFFGVGAAAVATLLGTMTGNYQVGMIWGVSIAIAIYVSRHLSGAHFNPAVSLAMVVARRMPVRELPAYFAGQFGGAFLGGWALLPLFDDTIRKTVSNYALSTSASSVWVEQFPNNAKAYVSIFEGALAEGLCVMLLIFVIFSLTSTDNTGRPNSHLAPLFIGLTVTIIIGTIGPLTNACLNPARDLGPRLAGCIMGWSTIAFYPGMWIVYYVAPVIGAVLGALIYTYFISPLHQRCVNNSEVPCDSNSPLCENLECDRRINQRIEKSEREL